MRVAALYDIHGNLPALEAVIDELRVAGVDRVVVGGDVVPGPMPRQALASLKDLELPMDFIRGNGEREVLAALTGSESAQLPDSVREVLRWTGEQLTRQQVETIATWPPTVRHHVTGIGDVLFCHATPRDDSEIFTARTSSEALWPLFEPTGAAMVVCGHTHMQFERAVGTVNVVNAGSVGMPFGGSGAYWAIFGPAVELRRTRYDLEAAAARIRSCGYPEAEQFAARYVLEPPSEEDMLAAFERSALR